MFLNRAQTKGWTEALLGAFLLFGCMAFSGSCAYALPVQATLIKDRQALLPFVYPVMGPRISSDYGMRKHPVRRVRKHHHGVDLAAPVDAPIRAVANGRVMYSDPLGGYGKLVVIQHADGITSHYGHCNALKVAPGQKVRAGEIIGTVGSTGISTGPHLHFEIRKNGEPIDPENFLPGIALHGEG